MSGVIASIVAALAAIVCGTLVWRGRLIPLALAAGLDVGFGIGLPRGGSAVGAMLRMLPADEARSAESIIMVAAVVMFVAAILCVLSVPSALKLRQWARNELAATEPTMPVAPLDLEIAPTRERPSLQYQQPPAPPQPPSLMPLPPPPPPPPGSRPPPAPAPMPAPGAPPGNTLRGMTAQKLMPTQVLDIGPPRRGARTAVIIGIAVTLIAVGIVVVTATLGDTPDGLTPKAGIATNAARTGSGSGSASSVATAASDAAVVDEADAEPAPLTTPSIDDFVAQFHDALSKADIGALVDPKAFAIGADSNDLAEGRDAVVAQVRADLGAAGPVTVKFSLTGQDGDTAWLAEELRIGSATFVLTAGLALRDGAWAIVALHMGEPMPNATAYRLAREGNLSTPDVVPNTNDTSELAKAMATAFASKPSFVEARSTRPEAFNFGSASGERLEGGETIRKVFGRINAVIKLHDAVKVGALGERGGWGVANVDFTESLRDGDVTQTFRVLAIWVKEEAGWRIVVTQFSNAR